MRGLLGTPRGLVGDRNLRALLSSNCASGCCGGLACRWIKIVWCCDPLRFYWLRMNEPGCVNYSPNAYVIPSDRSITFSVEGTCYTTDPENILENELQIPEGDLRAPPAVQVAADGSNLMQGCEDTRCDPCPECCGSVLADWCGFDGPTCCSCGSTYYLDVVVTYSGSSTIQPYAVCMPPLMQPEVLDHESSVFTIALRYRYRCDIVGGKPRRSIVEVSREVTHVQSEGRIRVEFTCCELGGVIGITQIAPNVIPPRDAVYIPPTEGCGLDPRNGGLPAIPGGFIGGLFGSYIGPSWVEALPGQCSNHEESFTDNCSPPNYNCQAGLPDYWRSTWNIERGCSGGSVTNQREYRVSGSVAGVSIARSGPGCACSPACDVEVEGRFSGIVTGTSTYAASWHTTVVDPCNDPPCDKQQPAVGLVAGPSPRGRFQPLRASGGVASTSGGRRLEDIALEGL